MKPIDFTPRNNKETKILDLMVHHTYSGVTTIW